MSGLDPLAGPETVGAFAVVRSEDPAVFLAEDAEVISRVLALQLVAQLPAAEVSTTARLTEMRRALLEERWADAVLVWIDETGTAVDVYEEIPKVWTAADLDAEQAAMEIRVSPLFGEDEQNLGPAD